LIGRFHSNPGAVLARVVGVLFDAPVMLTVTAIVNRSSLGM
jgi:ACR3 family arsenite efflux pump ArsB